MKKIKFNKFIVPEILTILVIAAALGGYWLWSSPSKTVEVVKEAPATPKVLSEVSLPFNGEYSDVQKRFTITPPANWLMKNKDIGNAAVQFINPVIDGDETGKFSVNINVLVEASSLTAEDYAKASENTLSRLLTNYKLVDFKKMKFGSLSGYIVGGTFENRGIALRNRQIFVTNKGNVYIVTAISLSSLWDKYVQDFNNSLYGFRVK